MDAKLLINAIVKQTTVLIASLSTASGIRAPLAHVADQVFLDLAREIEAHGVGRKVVADMFGLALRTYQRKVQRLNESISERNRSLWEAVFQFINENERLGRKQIEKRFQQDLPEDVAAVLNDLVINGLVFTSGQGTNAVYRPAPALTMPADVDSNDIDALANLVWATVYRRYANTLKALNQTLGVPREDILRAISLLIEDGRIKRDGDGDDDDAVFTASTLLVPVNAEQGWEAAVFDHFSTMAAAIAAKVNKGPVSQAEDVVGGSTLSFIIHTNHPYRNEVYGLLKQIRIQLNELWDRVENYNRSNPVPEEGKEKVHFYFGQNVESQDGHLSDQ
jgi:hypothetical protein